jgi:nitronate monooxygenase
MVLNRLNLADLDVPVIVALMAGGPSTPELAAAATSAGGLGFIAAGLLPADAFAERIIAARKLTSGPLGVNLFGPQPSAGTVQGVRGRAGR